MTHEPVIGPIIAPLLHVMSYNIHVRSPESAPKDPAYWARREPLVRLLLAAERPTLLGAQEALPDQNNSLLDALGSGYRSLGDGRDAGLTGERCPIIWDSTRLELLDWTQSMLSDAPEVPGSRTWGNRYPRIAVKAAFRDRATGAVMSVINTHLDDSSPRARLEAARVLRQFVASSPDPTIVTGDFNADAGSRTYRALTGTGALRDSWSTARHRTSDAWGTFPDYRSPRRNGRRIDWILTSPAIDVEVAAINTTRFDRAWPSDHAPVQGVLRMPPS